MNSSYVEGKELSDNKMLIATFVFDKKITSLTLNGSIIQSKQESAGKDIVVAGLLSHTPYTFNGFTCGPTESSTTKTEILIDTSKTYTCVVTPTTGTPATPPTLSIQANIEKCLSTSSCKDRRFIELTQDGKKESMDCGTNLTIALLLFMN